MTPHWGYLLGGHNFIKGQEVTQPCYYRSNSLYFEYDNEHDMFGGMQKT